MVVKRACCCTMIRLELSWWLEICIGSLYLGYFAECNDTNVRLVGGVESTNPTFGRVEICYGGIWGTVCDDLWDNVDASVVCTQVGFSSEGKLVSIILRLLQLLSKWTFNFISGAFALFSATFGRGDGPIFLDSVVCTGDESSLAECQHQGVASHDCSHSEDAGVVCPGEIWCVWTHKHKHTHTHIHTLTHICTHTHNTHTHNTHTHTHTHTHRTYIYTQHTHTLLHIIVIYVFIKGEGHSIGNG